MAKLWIAEYDALARDANNQPIQVPLEEALHEQTPVDFSGGEAKSEAVQGGTRFVYITADANCHFLVGTDPTATTNNQRLAAGQGRFFGIRQGRKISVIAE